jgi:septal ring factor EnvC (AmiA/AmiB activator)
VWAVVAVLFLGAAATFGTLWYLERDNHQQTSEQLSTKEKELADEQKAHDETTSQLSAAEKAKTDAEAKVTALTSCADAGKKIARLALANASEEEATQAGAALVLACGK